MSENSKIEWCDHTFNPWIGCTKVSPGCEHCYAEFLMDIRYHKVEWGPGKPRVRTAPDNWNKVKSWNRLAGQGKFVECDICGKREFRKWDDTLPPGGLACCSTEDCMALPETECSSVRPRVFCASLSDWLDNEVPTEWLADLLMMVMDCTHLDWLMLSKRPQNWRKRLSEVLILPNLPAPLGAWISLWLQGSYPANVWIGTTVEDQKRADQRLPFILEIPAKFRFLSCEPLLESIDLREWLLFHPEKIIHWIICGGESGKGARPMSAEWAASLAQQCADARVPFLFKQWGEHDENGQHVGKVKAGRILGGMDFTAYPEAL